MSIYFLEKKIIKLKNNNKKRRITLVYTVYNRFALGRVF